MVGTWQSANSRFNIAAQCASAHYGIGYDGTIYQWVDEDKVAYHAGKYAVNQASIGIEHEDMGNYNSPRPDALYNSSSKLVADICKFYGITINRTNIIKHLEVPYSTACPDSLDIERIVKGASSIGAPTVPYIQIEQNVYTALLNSKANMIKVGALFGMDEIASQSPTAGQTIVDNVKRLMETNGGSVATLANVKLKLQEIFNILQIK
jgi:hypothetical protein